LRAIERIERRTHCGDSGWFIGSSVDLLGGISRQIVQPRFIRTIGDL
jgi:hypothetical protein